MQFEPIRQSRGRGGVERPSKPGQLGRASQDIAVTVRRTGPWIDFRCEPIHRCCLHYGLDFTTVVERRSRHRQSASEARMRPPGVVVTVPPKAANWMIARGWEYIGQTAGGRQATAQCYECHSQRRGETETGIGGTRLPSESPPISQPRGPSASPEAPTSNRSLRGNGGLKISPRTASESGAPLRGNTP